MRAAFISRLAGPLLVLAVGVYLPAQTTGTLAGTITTADGSPVGPARVAVRGTLLATVADDDGAFRLHGVPTQDQTLDVRMLGYQPRALAFEVVAGRTRRKATKV
jgi:iron complex outermembrane recepter protein